MQNQSAADVIAWVSWLHQKIEERKIIFASRTHLLSIVYARANIPRLAYNTRRHFNPQISTTSVAR